MSEEPQKKTESYPPVFQTIWQDAWTAITSPRQYLRWAFQPVSRSLKFLTLLCVFLSVILALYALLTVRPMALEVGAWAKEKLPRITFEDDVLSTKQDQTVSVTDSQRFFFKIDPTQGADDEPHIDNFYEFGLLFTSDQAVIQSEGEEETYLYSELLIPDFSVSGEQVNNWVQENFIWTILFLFPPLLFAYHWVSKLLFSAFFAFLLWLASGFRGQYAHLFNIAIYALVPAVTIGYLLLLFFALSGFYAIVYVIYLLLAFTHYRRLIQLKEQPKEEK